MRQGNNETGLYFPLMRQGSIFQSLSLAGRTIDSLDREATPPYLPSFFSLPPFLPILPPHPPSIRWTTNRNVVSGSTVKAKPSYTSFPDAKPSKPIPYRAAVHGVSAPAYVSTKQHLHG